MRAVSSPLPPPSLLLLSLSLSPVLCDPTRQLRLKQPEDSNLQGFTFRDDLLLDIPVRSMIHCATVCANTERCVTFTYTRGSSADVTSVPKGGDCRIHSARMKSSSFMINTSNAEVYQNEAEWLQQACTVNADCPAVNSECFSGECLCTPGYLYSRSRLTCEASCSSLSNTFLEYPFHGFSGHDVGSSRSGRTLQECKDRCVAHSTVTPCRTMVRVSDGSSCWFKYKTALDEPSSWGTSTSHAYQRTCN